ncbi:MAG: hypothetical protein MZV70_52650 [Desulfobacterales bacterium]|nr:hypothetical protein [Desulfobacterales bacterium]
MLPRSGRGRISCRHSLPQKCTKKRRTLLAEIKDGFLIQADLTDIEQMDAMIGKNSKIRQAAWMFWSIMPGNRLTPISFP